MRTYNVFLHPRGRVQKLSSISFPVRYPNCSECMCVCVCRRWRRTMAAIVAITELSWTNLTFVPADNFSWLSYRNNNQSGVWDVYLEARSAAKKLLLFQIFPLFQPRHKDTECWVCNRAAWLWLPVNLQSSLCYSFVISSACVCDFSGTGVRMWWHAPWAAWWRTGWRRTSNQTTSAARGASVQEWREYLLLLVFCPPRLRLPVPQTSVSSVRPVSRLWTLNHSALSHFSFFILTGKSSPGGVRFCLGSFITRTSLWT